MKITNLLLAVFLFTGAAASADFQAIEEKSQAYEVANTASDIFSVKRIQIGQFVYKIVSMDSRLNGDLSSTTIVLVGQGEVGGAAGYDAAFQLSPTETRNSLKSVRKVGRELELKFSSLEGADSTVIVTYDSALKTLKER